jgi:dihydroorotate dehydrogenase subfamily 1
VEAFRKFEALAVDLGVHFAGLNFKNPLLPGSGPPGATLNKLRQLETAGVGGLITKTISVAPTHVPTPRMAMDGDLFFNIEKWSEKPYSDWLQSVLPELQSRTVPLLVSLGYTPADLETLIPLFDPLCDGFELSTHYVSGSPENLEALTRLAKRLTAKPVFMKLSVHGDDIVQSAFACERGGADGVTAINSIGPVMSIDIDKRASRLGEDNPYSWLSGPAIKPVALRAVYDIARAVTIPVMACGGVATGRDVIEFIMAGASAVECCTSLVRHGPDLVPGIVSEINQWCSKEQLADWGEIRGKVIPHFLTAKLTHE